MALLWNPESLLQRLKELADPENLLNPGVIINPDPAAPAFKHFTIKPNRVGGLTSARASYESVRGRIVSDWKAKDGCFELTVTIPANTTATVYVPVADRASIKEGGKPAADAEGARFLQVEDGRALFEVGSGTYHFTAPL